MKPASANVDTTNTNEIAESRVPRSRTRRRSAKALAAELQAAYQLINQLRGEIDRLGDTLESQRSRYESLLADERAEQVQLLDARSTRGRKLGHQLDKLRVENDNLRHERAELSSSKAKACDAYRGALVGLRRAFERRLRDQQQLAKCAASPVLRVAS
jgi:chromosome segregation ATPase